MSSGETKSVATRSLRILVVDDHDLVRQGLRTLLERVPGWVICGETGNGVEAVALARGLRPDVVVIDLHMPGMDGLQATREILGANSQTEILILTLDEGEEVARAAAEAGAHALVMKSDAASDLVAAVAALAQHQPYFSPKASQIPAQALARPLGAKVAEPAVLTSRERDVVIMVDAGRSNKEIADALNISTKTVEGHRRNIMRKLGLGSTAELVRYAVRNHVCEP